MDLKELSGRLALMDGIIPSGDVVEALLAGQEAKRQVVLWSRVTYVTIGIALAAVLFANLRHTDASVSELRLSLYRTTCVSPEVVGQMLDRYEEIATTNRECIELHRQNKDFFEAQVLNDPTGQCFGPYEVQPGPLVSSMSLTDSVH